MSIIVDPCAPAKSGIPNCYTYEDLLNIATIWNTYGNSNRNPINIVTDRDQLYYNIRNQFYNKCKDDPKCWLSNETIHKYGGEELLMNTFKPSGPISNGSKRNYLWLSNIDIINMMVQYEYKHLEFSFLGAVPYDFFQLADYRYHIKNNLNERGKYKFGLIINFDREGQSGSHWVSLYINTITNEIYYFDSVGKKPKQLIEYFIGKVQRALESTNNIPVTYKYNKNKHQKKNSECGVYSINFIIALLNKKSFDYISNNVIHDDNMNECRNYYFNK
jgi:hypothetical protein